MNRIILASRRIPFWQRALVAFLIGFVVIVSGRVLDLSMNRQRDSFEARERALSTATESLLVARERVSALAGAGRGLLIEGDSSFQSQFESGFIAATVALQNASSASAALNSRISGVDDSLKAWNQSTGEAISARSSGDLAAAARASATAQSLQDDLIAQLDALIADTRADLESARNALTALARRARTTQLIALGLALLLTLPVVALLILSVLIPLRGMDRGARALASGEFGVVIGDKGRDEMGNVSRTLDETSARIRQMLDLTERTSSELAAAAHELAAHVEESSRSLASIDSTVQEISRGAGGQIASIGAAQSVVDQMATGVDSMVPVSEKARLAAEDALRDAASGTAGVEHAREVMNQLERSSSALADELGGLAESGRDISSIVDRVRGITRQTNLLALNAAIEAARAGDYGRGFGIVASEIRKLSDESGEAASNIEAILTEIQKRTDEAVSAIRQSAADTARGANAVDEAGAAFDHISASVETSASDVGSAARSLTEVARSRGQVVSSMDEVVEIANETASAVEGVSSATTQAVLSAREIETTAAGLAEAANRLKFVMAEWTTPD